MGRKDRRGYCGVCLDDRVRVRGETELWNKQDIDHVSRHSSGRLSYLTLQGATTACLLLPQIRESWKIRWGAPPPPFPLPHPRDKINQHSPLMTCYVPVVTLSQYRANSITVSHNAKFLCAFHEPKTCVASTSTQFEGLPLYLRPLKFSLERWTFYGYKSTFLPHEYNMMSNCTAQKLRKSK